jgi:hypothetical protein
MTRLLAGGALMRQNIGKIILVLGCMALLATWIEWYYYCISFHGTPILMLCQVGMRPFPSWSNAYLLRNESLGGFCPTRCPNGLHRAGTRYGSPGCAGGGAKARPLRGQLILWNRWVGWYP